jgi:hypothetical protein
MADDLTAARKELDDEFEQVRKSLRKIHEELAEVDRLGPEDDLEGALDKLEDTVKKARTGGLFGGGAKGHKKALEDYRKLTGR